MDETRRQDVERTLARARKTVAESRKMIEQMNLRIRETDRFLAQQGLTREQVRNMRFTREQRLLANEELKRLGLPPIEEDDDRADFDAATASLRATLASDGGGAVDAVDERRRKFGIFMQGMRP